MRGANAYRCIGQFHVQQCHNHRLTYVVCKSIDSRAAGVNGSSSLFAISNLWLNPLHPTASIPAAGSAAVVSTSAVWSQTSLLNYTVAWILLLLNRWHDTQPPQLLPLGHLTACTGLCTGPYHIKPEDVLPPNLQHLVIAGCPAAKPLLQLAKLESLVLDDFIPGAEMELLADALTRLTTMELGMQSLEAKVSAADVEVAARAWRRLPIDQLRLGEQLQLSAVSLQHVGQLHCLNWLDIDFADYDAFVDVLRPLTTALLQLRRLSTLQLSAGVGDVDMVINAQREALQQELCMFVQALGSLPWLSTLVCRGIGAGPSALVHLSAAKRLSDLVWYGDVTDFVLNTWAWSFQHLRRLIIRDASVTDAALPTIARTLKKLEDLDLSSTDVTNLGIQCLSALTSLSALRVIDTYVSHGVVERVLNSCALLRAPSVVLER